MNVNFKLREEVNAVTLMAEGFQPLHKDELGDTEWTATFTSETGSKWTVRIELCNWHIDELEFIL